MNLFTAWFESLGHEGNFSEAHQLLLKVVALLMYAAKQHCKILYIINKLNEHTYNKNNVQY